MVTLRGTYDKHNFKIYYLKLFDPIYKNLMNNIFKKKNQNQ